MDVPPDKGEGGQEEGGAPRTTVASVIAAARTTLLTGRPDLFLVPDGSGTVRPGILVLVNDVDWELW